MPKDKIFPPKKMPIVQGALYYTTSDSGASIEKARGVVIGVVSTLMGVYEINFRAAIEILMANMPPLFREDAIPEVWGDDIPLGGEDE